jgi:protein disulfide-isomerase
MKTFTQGLFVSVGALLFFSGSALAAAGWSEDYAKAMEKAKAENKHVLLNFTGSDWCGWCIKLDKEVFSKKEFKDYAKEKLVLVDVDFPQGKRQTKKVKEQNEKLQTEHGVEGFPTLLILDPEGKKVGEMGYVEGGPTAFLPKLQAFVEKK